MNEEEIEKAIKLLKESVDNPKIYSKRCVYFDEYQMDKLKQLSYKLIEELKQEKEKNKKLEEERQHLMDGYLKQAEIKMKIINMIAVDYMNNHISGEYSDTPCEYYEEIEMKEKCKENNWDNVSFGDCKECLIDYYFKKARGEENGNKN